VPDHGLVWALEQKALQSAFDCSVCRVTMEHGGQRVILRASWRGVTETICQRCWHTMMAYSAIGLKHCGGEGPFEDH
jgi:hypothetical protein